MPAVRVLFLVLALAVAGLVATSPARAAVSLNPGAAIFSDGGACVVGAYVTDGHADYILTSPACGGLGTTWYADEAHTVLVGTNLGNGDLIALAPGVTPVHAFDGVGNPNIGEHVCTPTAEGPVACGVITGVDRTIQMETGIITHVISATACGRSSISVLGAPLFDNGVLLGIRPFDDGCTVDAFFESATRVLASEGVTLL